MTRSYSAREMADIIARHRDDERGIRLVGLCLAAASGFLTACLLFGAARFFGWW